MEVKEYINMLGLKVEDKVTGFTGTVSSVSFDLYGCIQVLVSPHVSKEGKTGDSVWFDFNRLEVNDPNPVMEPPEFEYGTIAGVDKGPALKPINKA